MSAGQCCELNVRYVRVSLANLFPSNTAHEFWFSFIISIKHQCNILLTEPKNALLKLGYCQNGNHWAPYSSWGRDSSWRDFITGDWGWCWTSSNLSFLDGSHRNYEFVVLSIFLRQSRPTFSITWNRDTKTFINFKLPTWSLNVLVWNDSSI